MSYYVKRQDRETERVGWTGPIRATKQAYKEADAWVHAGWKAWVQESTPEVRAEVRAWTRARQLERAGQQS